MCDQKKGCDYKKDLDELSASDDSEPEEGYSSAPFDLQLDHPDDEREISAAGVGGDYAQSAFSLRGGGSAFSNRSQSIFDCLDSVAQQQDSSSFLNQEKVPDAVFAQPLPPPPHPGRKTYQPLSSCPIPAKKRGAPDYLLHPERWTHYSLEDVTETSDQANSKAAHTFLASLQQREEPLESQKDPPCNIQHHLIFSRPTGRQKEQPSDPLSAVKGKEKEPCLSHLQEEEEEGGKEEHTSGGRRTEQSVETSAERAREQNKDMSRAVGPSEEKNHKERGEEEKVLEANTGFTSFRKTKRKNYRKSSAQKNN